MRNSADLGVDIYLFSDQIVKIPDFSLGGPDGKEIIILILVVNLY